MVCVTCILFWSVITLIVIKLYIKLTTGWCKSNVCLVGKTVIVTGANSGIGYEVAEDLAKRGAKVIVACRDTGRGQDAVESIIKATNNKNIIFKQLDLDSFSSVRAFASDVKKSEERLDILINNAGALGLGRTRGENDLLLQMQTNYFGPFLLTNLLLELVKKTPNSRIINVSSIAVKRISNFSVNDLNLYPEEMWDPAFVVYARSKLCNILFTIELANRIRGSSATTYSLHPGVIPTDIFKRVPSLISFLLYQVLVWFLKNRLEGAQTTIYCSVAKGIESLSGEHFSDCQVVSRYRSAIDPELPKTLWKASEELVKLKSS